MPFVKHVVKGLSRVALVLVLWQIAVQADCITIGGPSPPKPPIRVSAAFCGTAVAGADPLTSQDLELIDADTGVMVGKVHVDSRGHFRLSKLPVGRYRVHLAGFMTSEAVEITTSGKACEQPILVKMIVAGECSPASHVSRLPRSR